MRTSRKQLERLVEMMSKAQGRPEQAWTKLEDGNYRCNVGALMLNHNATYGGWDLVEMVNQSGGEHSLIGNTFAGRGRLKAHEMESFLLGAMTALQGTPYWPLKAEQEEDLERAMSRITATRLVCQT